MRKILLLSFSFISLICSAQKKKFNITDRAADHFLIQLSSDHWMGAPDSVSSRIRGISRGLNIYAMIDKPFKSNPRFSIGLGIGVSSSNIFFNRMMVDISSTNRTLPFINQDTTAYYKKFKLSTNFLEVPVEFRYFANPENPSKGFKFAVGVKGGILLNAHTKAKLLNDAKGNRINAATWKTTSKAYFNTTRLSATARIGYGMFSLFGSYSLGNMFKDGVAAPDVRTLQVGLTFSGL